MGQKNVEEYWVNRIL